MSLLVTRHSKKLHLQRCHFFNLFPGTSVFVGIVQQSLQRLRMSAAGRYRRQYECLMNETVIMQSLSFLHCMSLTLSNLPGYKKTTEASKPTIMHDGSLWPQTVCLNVFSLQNMFNIYRVDYEPLRLKGNRALSIFYAYKLSIIIVI